MLVSGQRGPGRPRDETIRRAVLAAAIDELTERGYQATTVEGIAARAGAGKQTLYRWWSGKADIVLEALLDTAESTIAVPDTGALADDLRAFLTDTFRQRGQRPVLVGLMAQALLDPTFGDAFRERFLFRRRDTLRGILERAAARGELGRRGSDPADVDLLIDVVFGVLWYRLLLEHAPLDDDAGARLARLVLAAVR